MTLETATDEAFLVGECLVQPALNSLTCEGTARHVEPKCMDVLVHLAARAGEVVGRDELFAAVWSDVHVGDESLTNAIIKLRRALGDDARHPKIIETIPKRGYRLIAPVRRASPNGPGAQPGDTTTGRLLRPGLVAATVVATLAAAAVWLFHGSGAPPQGLAGQGRTEKATTPSAVRVAVGPFEALGDAGAARLARLLEEEAVSRLALDSQLSVIHGTGRGDVLTDFVLEGAVTGTQRDGAATVRLLDARTGEVVATERLDLGTRPAAEIGPSDVRKTIAALARDVHRADLRRRASGYTDSPEAFALFLDAQAALLTRTRAGNARAIFLYRQAIRRDPRFARAYAGLALGLAAEYRNGWAEDGPAALEQALAMARTAAEILPDLPEQQWTLGYIHTQRREFDAARRALGRALALDPRFADAEALLGGIATYEGHPSESVERLRRAMRLRPEAGYLYFLLLARAYYFLGDCDQAEINVAEAIRRNAGNVEARLYHAACLVETGHHADAEWEIEEARTIEPALSRDSFFRTYPMTAQGQIERLRVALGRAGLG